MNEENHFGGYDPFKVPMKLSPNEKTPLPTKPQGMFPVWECLVPRLGTFHSQGGNKLFP